MANVHDVAAYIVERHGSLDTMKLQKLLYYSQAWHLVWDEEPLFANDIEAWANGPVVYDVFDKHRGRFSVSNWESGNPSRLTEEERSTIDAVVRSYGKMTGRQLSHLTHDERPWRNARKGLGPTQRGRDPIALDDMKSFYEALDADDEARDVDDIVWDQ